MKWPLTVPAYLKESNWFSILPLREKEACIGMGGARFPKSAYGSQATVAARLAKNYSLIIVLSHAAPSFAKPAIPKPQFPHIITNAESGMSIGRSFFDFFLSKRN